MTYWQIFVAPTKGWLTLILLSVLTLVSLIFSIVFVNLGPAVIFIPIILACMYYAKRGFVFSVFVAFIYFILTAALSSDPNVLQTAAIRVPFFILVAGVITYISLQRTRGEMALLKNTEELHAANEQLAAAGKELKSQFDALVESERGTRLSEERLIMAQEIGHTGCWEADLLTNTAWGSEELLRIFGIPGVAGNFPMEKFEACIPERERVHQSMVDLVHAGKEYNLEFAINPADGSVQKIIHSIARLEKDAWGNPLRILGVAQDITGRKQVEVTLLKNTEELHAAYEELTASEEELRSNLVDLTRKEEALRESEQRYRYLFDSAPDGITVVDETGIIVGCNQCTLDVTGYTKEELLGKHITHDIQLSSKGVFSERFPLLQQNKSIEGEIRIARKDGNIVWIWRKGFPLPDRAGKFSGALLYDRDITDRKRTDDTLRRVNQKLNVLSQLTRKDLTNQTFVLGSYLELTKNQLAGQDRIIETLQKGFEAVRLINETIAYSKDYQDMGAKPPKWQNVKMALLLGLSHISIGNIQHSIETADLEIFADPLLEKVFQRFFENSVKHGGHVTRIRVWHTVTPEGATVVFEDNGAGIPEEKKEQIFLRGEGTSASRGSLIFVREILSITGITIKETGEPGKGARFEMTVPKGMWQMAGTVTDDLDRRKA